MGLVHVLPDGEDHCATDHAQMATMDSTALSCVGAEMVVSVIQ